MLKKFFIAMLGSMAGFWLSVLLFVIGSIFITAVLIGKELVGRGKTDIKGEKILLVDLSGTIPEREGGSSMSGIMSYMSDPTDDLSSILKAVRCAADDKNIKGVFIDCKGSSLGVASRSEILDALKYFKESGKFVYAYADYYDQGDYYVASIADSIFLNPVGMVNVHGLCSTTIFYKDVLDKLGIDVNVVRVGSFKSAVEPYMRMSMSEESRMQTSVFVNSIWGDISKEIANNRRLDSPHVVDVWADSIMAFSFAPEQFVDQGAVSSLKYRSQVDDILRKKMDVGADEDIPFVSVMDYSTSKSVKEIVSDDKHIAVLYAVGEIVESGDEGIVGDKMVPEIRRLAKDDNVKGLILRVNSGGGSAFASEQIWKALEDFKTTGKPFYVSMGDYAASGGYYISCGADKIYSDASTLTGSIGIFGIIPNAQKLVKDKLGFGIENVSTGKNANFPSLVEKPTPQQLASMQLYVNRGYDTFTSRVASGRNMSVDSVKIIGGGRIWDGSSALQLGLVDKIGGLYDCIDDMAGDLGLDQSDVIAYPNIELNMLEMILKESKGKFAVDLDAIDLEQAKRYLDALSTIRNMSPLQARMEQVVLQ